MVALLIGIFLCCCLLQCRTAGCCRRRRRRQKRRFGGRPLQDAERGRALEMTERYKAGPTHAPQTYRGGIQEGQHASTSATGVTNPSHTFNAPLPTSVAGAVSPPGEALKPGEESEFVNPYIQPHSAVNAAGYAPVPGYFSIEELPLPPPPSPSDTSSASSTDGLFGGWWCKGRKKKQKVK